ncbi:MAG: RICIN domain-containing protein [Halanaerobiales bacterium]
MKKVVFLVSIMIFMLGSISFANGVEPSETYQANHTYRFDLDGDGRLDVINYVCDRESSPVFYINQEMYTLDQASPELFLDNYKIVDIDKSDNYSEIAIGYATPSNKNIIAFYRFTPTGVNYIGDMPGKLQDIGKNIAISGNGDIINTINSEFVQGAVYKIYYGLHNNSLIQTSRDDIYYYQERLQRNISGNKIFYKELNSNEFVTFDSDVSTTFIGEVDGMVWVQIKDDYYWLNGNAKLISFASYELDSEQKKRVKNHGDSCYTSFPDSDGNIILAIYAESEYRRGYKLNVVSVVEVEDRLEVYVKKTFQQKDYMLDDWYIPSTVVKLDSSNDNIVIKESDGDVFSYFLSGTFQVEMAPPSTEYVYSIENVMAEKFIDIPGTAPDQGLTDAELQLWDMDYQPDRYVELISTDIDGYFYVKPLHCSDVWDVEGANRANGTDLQLHPRNNQSNQQFKFIYAGEAMTYYIQGRHSQKVLSASIDNIYENGSPIQISPLNDSNDNQKWRLHAYQKWQLPPIDQDFYIRGAYIDHYLSVDGSRHEGDFVGRYLQMQERNNIGNVRVKVLPSVDARWINLEVQIGTGIYISIDNNSKNMGVPLELLPYNKGSNSQKFAVQFTSPTTFILRTRNMLAVDIGGEGDRHATMSGAVLLQYPTHYGISQQFQLVYASGPKEGDVYQFPALSGE